uniref:Perforin-1-like n=1 Tax=Leptobrachium leishanense TaxID=445787 RepID=A0A8C5QBH8_9ANUR
MLSILTLLLLIPAPVLSDNPVLTYSCHTEKKQKCLKRPFVPGHTLLGEGVNIVTMKKTGANVIDMQLFLSQRNTCTVCKNPYKNMAVQKLPLAMADWKPYSSCSRKVSSEVSRSAVSLAEEMGSEVQNNWEAGLELQHPSGNAKVVLAGSHSEINKFTEEKSNSDRYSFVKQQVSCVYYRFNLKQNPSLSQNFKESVKSLPESYSVKTKYEYLQFIRRYGTHYISQADVGGEVVEVTAIKTCQVALQGASVEELKDCLNIETNVAVTGKVEANAKASACRELSQKMTRQNNFHQTFNERTWQVRGGSIKFDLLSINNKDNNAAQFETWMESLKKDPDIVTYSLEPVHDLLKSELKENLQKAVSEYIMEKALWKNCSCTGNSQPSEGAKCTCFCPRSEFLTPSCCPAKKGLAKVVVTIQSGSGLWGDYISKTDSYVKVNSGTKTYKTGTIWNNDNPVWNTSFDINPADLELITSIDIEVWDVDNGYDDDRLGSCKKTLTSGDKSDVCHLDHGTLNYKENDQ